MVERLSSQFSSRIASNTVNTFTHDDCVVGIFAQFLKLLFMVALCVSAFSSILHIKEDRSCLKDSVADVAE